MELRLQLGVLRVSESGTFDTALLQPQTTGHDETRTIIRCNHKSKTEVANLVGEMGRFPSDEIRTLGFDKNLARTQKFEFGGR
jgi:hypothetical protein